VNGWAQWTLIGTVFIVAGFSVLAYVLMDPARGEADDGCRYEPEGLPSGGPGYGSAAVIGSRGEEPLLLVSPGDDTTETDCLAGGVR
jgi:hypothetical protein